MMATNIELYEALKPHVGEEGARLIAEAVPGASELATKDDLKLFRSDVLEFKNEMRAEFQGLRLEIAEFKAEMRGWMLKFFVPLWIGVYGTLGAIVVSILVRS